MTEEVSNKLKKRSRPTVELFEKILILDTDFRHYHETQYYDSFDRNEFSFDSSWKQISEDEFYENQQNFKCLVVIA